MDDKIAVLYKKLSSCGLSRNQVIMSLIGFKYPKERKRGRNPRNTREILICGTLTTIQFSFQSRSTVLGFKKKCEACREGSFTWGIHFIRGRRIGCQNVFLEYCSIDRSCGSTTRRIK